MCFTLKIEPKTISESIKNNIWPYKVEIDPKIIWKNETPGDWCKANIGLRFKDWYCYGFNNKNMFAFKDAETALVFKLKWGYK